MIKKTLIFSVLFLLFIGTFSLISAYFTYVNKEVELHNIFKQKMDQRKAFYQKLFTTIKSKGKVAMRNDSSFQRNIYVIMGNRKDSDKLFMKWVTESNPNANFSEVSALYKDLSRSIEGLRDGFFEEEKMIQDIIMQHNNLLEKVPSKWFLSFVDVKILEYKPISSDDTDEVFATNKDNNTNPF